MTTIIVLFNLKPGISPAIYEHWALTTDLPTVRALQSVPNFNAMRVHGLLGSDAPAPYHYAEIIEVNDMTVFGQDIGSDIMQKVSAEFQTFADQPIFLLCQSIEPSA